jgi:hypothetical protein
LQDDEKEVSRVSRATNILTELYFWQVIGRFVRMQEGLPIHDKKDKCGASIAFSSAPWCERPAAIIASLMRTHQANRRIGRSSDRRATGPQHCTAGKMAGLRPYGGEAQ